MSRIVVRSLVAAFALALPLLGLAQQVPGPTFEVAAINTAATLDLARIATSGNLSNLRIGMNITETRVDISYMTLANLLPVAFAVPAYRVSAPAWLNEERFDIRATIPPGATREQVPQMLQALLVARFGMVFHREPRELPVYSLVVGKDGPKLQEAAPLAATPAAEPAPDDVVIGTGDNQLRMTRAGANATSMTVSTNRTSMNIKMGDNGAMHLDVTRMTMAELVELLSPFVGRPVIDNTGLTGTYQLKLELSLVEIAGALRASGAAAGLTGLPGLGGAAATGGASPAAAAADPSGSSMFEAVQKLGLRLDSKRTPIDVVVIDKMERNPTPN